ncbi:MAG: hypothetical protein ACE5MK_01805 [Acidobacteriota bacterium]
MRKHHFHLFVLIVLIGLFATVAFETRSQNLEEDSGVGQIEYRPGAYFPEGFPLHGQVRLLSSPVVEAGKRERIRFEYTVGDLPIERGMSLEIWKHFTSDVEQFQNTDPPAPAYFSAEFSKPEVEGSTRIFTNWVRRNTPSVFPYRKTAAVNIEKGTLREGDSVVFDLGGPQGVRMQHYEENLFNFRVAIVREDKVLGYGGDTLLKVTGGPVGKLRVQAPSIVKLREQFPVEVVPQDEWGSLAKDSQGLTIRMTSGAVTGGHFRYEPRLQHYVARDVLATSEGIVRIGVETSDGKIRALSNPIWVERYPNRRVYYGELHQHSYLHDGRGVFEEVYLYGRRVGLLDFGALTSHHLYIKGGSGPRYHLEGAQWPMDHWPEIERANQKLNGWQDLVTILGYEYSVGTRVGGHHNVYYNADEAPTAMHLDPVSPAAPIAKMLKTLQLVRKPTLVIPHVGGGPPDWSHPTDPRIERLFEIASVHGVFEESYFKHLETGLRLGAIGAGDTHTSAMGNAYPGLIYTMTNALAGVYASGRSRDEIWKGLYEKRTFAVTGNTRCLLDFRVNGEQMGGELPSGLAKHAKLEAKVSGTAPLVRVQLLKNLKVIYSAEPARKNGNLVRVIWGDNYYQRRAAEGLASGELLAEEGKLQLRTILHRDQGFEEIQQQGDAITWTTAAVSGDRDGFLVDISQVRGDALRFRLDDSRMMGIIEVRIPLDELKNKGKFTWSKGGHPKVTHSYMQKMGVEPTFFLECELVDPEGAMDYSVTYLDPEPPKSGDFYMLRLEQLDTNKAWSSPVWVN